MSGFTFLINFFYATNYTDTATNHKLIKLECLNNMKLESKSFAIDFEIAKRQVDAIGQLTASQNTKTLVLPSDISGIFSAFSALMETLPKEKK